MILIFFVLSLQISNCRAKMFELLTNKDAIYLLSRWNCAYLLLFLIGAIPRLYVLVNRQQCRLLFWYYLTIAIECFLSACRWCGVWLICSSHKLLKIFKRTCTKAVDWHEHGSWRANILLTTHYVWPEEAVEFTTLVDMRNTKLYLASGVTSWFTSIWLLEIDRPTSSSRLF